MKKLYISLLFVFGWISLIAQSPIISVDPLFFTENLKVDSLKTFSFTISNTGNRDLHWELIPSIVFFEKENGADYTLAENQDRISDNVWITRADYRGIFNIAQESQFYHYLSPTGTEWYNGVTRDADPSLDYNDWNNEIGGDMDTDTVSMHLIQEDRFFDVVFESWVSGNAGGGGGFSYTRKEIFNWLLPKTKSGSIAPGNDGVVEFDLDGAGLFSGTYNGVIIISSDDVNNPEVEIPVTINVTGVAGISVNPTSLDFGDKEIGGTFTLPVEIENTKSDVLEISNLTLETSFFSVIETNISVEPKETYTLYVTFLPENLIAYTDTLRLTTNDSNNELVKIPLDGVGIKAPNISVDVTSYNENLISGNTVTRTITIDNTGDSTLNYRVKLHTDPVTFIKEDYADWTQPENHDKITPTVAIARKDYEGFFNILVEDAYNSPGPTGTLWAYGYSDDLTPGDYLGWRVVDNAPDMLNKPMSLYLIDDDLYIDYMLLDWTSNGQGGGYAYTREGAVYWIDRSLTTSSIVKSSNETVDVTFDATDLIAGVYDGDIIIKSNDPDQPEIVIPTTLTVTGTPEINGALEDFGSVYTNDSKTVKIEIENIGTDTLKISTIVNDSSYFSIYEFDQTVLASDKGIVTVTFSPEKDGSLIDTLYITSNDPVNPIYKIPLHGVGVLPPTISVDQTSISATLQSGNSTTKSVTIDNTGSTDLNWEINFYSSEMVTFTKESNTVSTLEENQDRISDIVWLTRTNSDGLFNIYVEEYYSGGTSPVGVEWGFDKSINLIPLDYSSWVTGNDEPMSYFDQTISMHLIDENRFFDVVFTDWDEGYTGGGFSYNRVEIPNWVNAPANTGIITSGNNEIVTFTLDAAYLNAGVYTADLHIFNNDAENDDIIIPITFTVTGIPEINADTLVEFGSVEIGNTKEDIFWLRNVGTDVLNITDITNGLSVFTVESKSFSIEPGDSTSIEVYFAPELTQLYEDTLEISSNDATDPIVKLALNGTGLEPPVASINITKIDTSLFSGATATYKLVIQNTGSTDLNWEIDGQMVEFVKANYADWTLEANQDRITDNVWVTRKDNQAIFNIAQENGYSTDSPKDTKWSYGNTASLSESDYESWVDAIDSDPQSMIGKDMSMHLVTDNMYFDLVFDSYAGGNIGGGFSYTRNEVLPDWLSFETEFGTILAGEKDTIDVTIDAAGVSGQNYANFSVFSNDPDNNQLTVNVSIYVAPILVINEIADVRLNEGFGTHEIDISTVFEDANGDPITIQPISDDESVVTVGVSVNTLTITEVAAGNTLISLRADDGNGNVEYTDFEFIVNAGPSVDNPIANVINNEGFASYDINLTNVFSDINGDSFILGVNSSDENKVTAAINVNTLTITEVAVGSSTITVSADDGFALTPTEASFSFRVNAIPTVSNPIADINVDEGFATSNVDLTNVFTDADAGDVLTYSAVSSNTSAVTVGVSSNTLTITEVAVGNSNITVTANDGVGGTVDDLFVFTINVANGVNELTNILDIYPNPTTGKLFIDTDKNADIIFVEIYDVTGKLIYNEKVNQNYVIDISNQSKGIYLLKLKSNDSEIATKKIILE